MADKKINQLDDAGTLTVNDYGVVNQDASTGKALKFTLGALRSFILGGANAGARIYFPIGVPSSSLGVDGDVAFDVQNDNIYEKVSGAWVFRVSFGSSGGVDQIRFTSVYGSGGLAANGLTYTNSDLIGMAPQTLTVETDELIRVENFGDIPAFDEWDFDDATGTFTFGSALPAGMRISIIYSS